MRRNRYDRLRPVRRLVQPVEALEARWFGRSLLSLLVRRPVLVLETTGRRTGRRRRTTLAYERVGADLYVVGGAGGQAALPDWVANLRADPHVRVTIDRRALPMVATELHGKERADAWARLVRAMPVIETYERRAGRLVPVVRLSSS